MNSVAVTATEQRLLSGGPARLDAVRLIGVDEHKWEHVFGADGDGFVTLITDLISVVAGQGRAQLLDLVPGRSAAAVRTWLEAREPAFRDGVRGVAMDGTQSAAGNEPELAYYLCAGPPGTGGDDLIPVAGARWAIEECFQTAKNEVGLAQYQVRHYDAWCRHITLALLAHAYLSVTAAIAPKDLAAGSSRSPSPNSDVSWHP